MSSITPGISRLSWNCITSYEFFIKCYLPTDSNFSRALSYWTLKDTDNWTESALQFNNSSVSFYKYEFVPDHAIPSLFGYIIDVTILTVLPGPYSRSTNFRRWTKLMSIFLIISFRFGLQACFGVCVLTVVPITFRFIIRLTWCHRRSITSSCNLSTNVLWSSSTLWALPGYQSDSWWEIPSLPRWFVLSSTTLLPSLQHKLVRVLCYTLSSLLSSICFSLPWSITIFYVRDVVRISPPLKNSW